MFKRPKSQTQVQIPIDFPDLHSLELVFDLVKDRHSVQMDQSDKLDTKAYSIMTSATALVSAALVLQAVLPSLQSFPKLPITGMILQVIPLALLLATYLGVMVTAIAAYKLRKFYYSPDPDALYQDYLQKSERYTKAKVLRAVIEDYRRNEKEIDRKITWNRWAIRALWTETILFVFFLCVHALR